MKQNFNKGLKWICAFDNKRFLAEFVLSCDGV